MLNVKQGNCEYQVLIFEVIGLTRLGIKPESTAQETYALYHSAIWAVNKFSDSAKRTHGVGTIHKKSMKL